MIKPGILLASLALLMGLAGCSQQEELSKEQKTTLEKNLNSPVDVDKERAEWEKKHGKPAASPEGAPTDKM